MPEKLAIKLKSVSKVYKLYGSQGDQLIDALSLQRFGFKTKREPKLFNALSDISIDVPRGHRIGIIGRNGAGKTTLLKLISGNFSPTTGSISVNGEVQALMSMGIGFHPDHTGRENVEASLQYNGLPKGLYTEAMEEIVQFCELGQFFDQPFKTYSLGMQARLMFATATAIRPDILIVDEVLGAGDAYFVAKSKSRVEKMVGSGCTMLLVSHSMQQVLELCSDAVWLHEGQIRMQGEAFLVVKAYEEYLHGPITQLTGPRGTSFVATDSFVASEETVPEKSAKVEPARAEPNARPVAERQDGILLQEPRFMPHADVPALPMVAAPQDFKFVARGGISRWGRDGALQICGFTMVTERGETNKLVALRSAKFVLNIVAEVAGVFECRYGIVLLDYSGSSRVRLISPPDRFAAEIGETRCVEMLFNPVQLGTGEYVLSASVHKADDLSIFNSTPRYDLLDRSFELTVELQESLASVAADFFHTAEWHFG